MAKKRQAKKKTQSTRQVVYKQPTEPAGELHFQKWITCTQKPSIAANQTVYARNIRVDTNNFPDLAPLFQRYFFTMVNTMTFKMKSGLGSANGNHATMIMPYQRYEDLPANLLPARTHAWLTTNDSVVKQITNDVTSPPANDRSKTLILNTVYADAANPGSYLGYGFWVFEGPALHADLAQIGEYQLYIDAIFICRR